jgi:hypothetical protein
MPVTRRTFLGAASGLFVTAASAQAPRAPTNLLADGGGGIPITETALSQLVAGMAPGTWRQLTGVSNQNAVLGSQSGSSGSLIYFGNTVAWNSLSQSIEIIGADHLGGASNWKQHVRYLAATNAFSVIQGQGALPNIGHAYDHTAVNPFNGDLYHTNYAGFSGSIPVYRKAMGAASFSLATNVAASDQVTHGACWWSGAFTGAGVQGCLLIFDCGNTAGQLRAYNPLNNSVFYSNNAAAPGSSSDSYHTVAEYSTVKNVAVYGGGSDSNQTKLWRITSNRTITAMPSVPSGKSVGVHDGNFVSEPVTGNFLLLSARQLWELDPNGSGTWTQQTGTRVPPSGVGDPGAPDGVISCAIPDLGVVAYITQPGTSGGTFYIYKHA